MIKYHSYSPTLAQLHGKKPSKVDRLIQLRSEMTHTEIQFSDRYGGISFSATMADECKCARFKMIAYSHPERWLSTSLCVSEAQEDAVFKVCCGMADVGEINMSINSRECKVAQCWFGPNALKYDLAAVSFSFITKWNIWHGSEKRVFCTEACFIALMEAWPEMLEFLDKATAKEFFKAKGVLLDEAGMEVFKLRTLNPDQLTPSLGDAVIRDWARRQG